MQQRTVIRRLELALAVAAALVAAPLAAQDTPSSAPSSAPPADAAATELDRVTVTGVRDAIFSARQQERDTDVISNVITADDAGQFADQNVAESLQRVPGLSIDRDAGEGRRVNVRGLGPQFNPVTVNGVLLATSDLDRDAVVDVLPNDLLGTLTVTKTLTPDMNPDAIGGAVDLRAIDPFERDDGGQLRLEAGRSEYGDQLEPKANAAVNRRINLDGGGRFGYSLSGSFSRRDRVGDIQRNRDVPRYTRIGADCNQDAPTPDCFLRSVRVDNRYEESERTRYGVAANFDFAPNESSRYFLRLIGSRYKRFDLRQTDSWRIGPTRATVLGPGFGTFLGGNDVELRKQTTFTKRDEQTYMAQLGGSNRAGDWQFDYWLAGSRNELDVPYDNTGRFRVRNIVIDYRQFEDSVEISGRRRTATTPDPANPAAYALDNLTVISERREDEILQAQLDARRDFDWAGRDAFLKFGAKLHRRDKTADRTEASGNPVGAGGVPATTLAQVPTYVPDSRIPGFGFFPQPGAARDLFARGAGRLSPQQVNSAAEDYVVEEDVDAVYAMASVDLSDTFSLFGGARFESTKWRTSGFELETVDPFAPGTDPVLTVRPISAPEKTYSDVLPSIHARWEPTETVVVRGSLGTALVRPNFDEGAATRQVLTVEQENGTYVRSLSGGNPNLDPLKARQADLSVAWYPSEATVLYAGVFYKRIDDFYIRSTLTGSDVATVGLPVGNGTINGGFDSATVFLNGDRATVRGVELSYEQAFVRLPGWLSGLFVTGNLTLVDSEADYSRIGRNDDLPLPDQADRIANVSVGWENDRFTVRVSGNYRDEQLDVVAGRPELDQVLTDYFSVDLNLRWNITKRWQAYFDASNLNDEKDVTVWRGNASSGGPFPADEGGAIDFGRSYALGLRYRF